MNRRTPAPGPTLVVAAWAPEFAGLRRRLGRRPKGAGGGPKVVLATVGVGLVEAGIGTAAAIEEHRPRQVVLIGTAGVFPGARSAHPVGSVAIADAVFLASQAVAEQAAYLPPALPAQLETHRGMCRALARASGLPSASVACPLGITRAPGLARNRERSFGAALENLEAFAAGRAAARTRVPFAAVLGIANVVGPAGHAQWREEGAAAANRACEAAAAWLFLAARA